MPNLNFAGALRSKMIKAGGMLMIGSAGRNVGKTELVCTLIRRFCRAADIVGVKVTPVAERGGECPRGGKGCGVCASLEGEFCITEETDRSSQKDTARLLAAGAKRVLWLRVLKDYFLEGAAALIDVIGRDAVCICESNSLRQVVEPGLFLIVQGRDAKKWKSSAQNVKRYADRVVTMEAGSFDLDLERLKLANRKWIMQEQATAIIMAGGDSRRIGVDKSMLCIEGKPMMEIICEQLRGTFEQILVSADDAKKFAFLGVHVVPDRVAGQGPLMGIASALEASGRELNFVVACDIPQINLVFVRRMLAEAEAADLVIPTAGDGKYEPLFAVYRKSAVEAMNEVLSSGGRKISDVFEKCRVKYMELGDAGWYVNLNTMAEYEAFREKSND